MGYFEQQRPELKKTGVPVKVIIDHKGQEYFMSIKILIRCQACWIEFLLEFNFIIFYTLGKLNQKAKLLI